MTIEIEESFNTDHKPEDVDGPLNGCECPHCGIWFRLNDGKPARENQVRCPNCGWLIDKSV